MKPITNPQELERLYRKAEQIYDFQRRIINPTWQAEHDWVVMPMLGYFSKYEFSYIPIALQALSISSCFAVCTLCFDKIAYLIDAINEDLWEFVEVFSITGDGLLFDEQLQFAVFRECASEYNLIAGPKTFVEQALDASLDTRARDFFKYGYIIKPYVAAEIWSYLEQLAQAHLAPDEEVQMRPTSQLPPAIHDLSDLLIRESKLPLDWLQARGWKAVPFLKQTPCWSEAYWMARAMSEICDTGFLYFPDSGEKYELTPTRDTLFHVFNEFTSQFFMITDAEMQFVLWHQEHYSVIAGQEQWIIRFLNTDNPLPEIFEDYFFDLRWTGVVPKDQKQELKAIGEYYQQLLD